MPGADSVCLGLLGKLEVGGGCVYRWAVSASNVWETLKKGLADDAWAAHVLRHTDADTQRHGRRHTYTLNKCNKK